jgi:hypothetical protein
VGWPPLASSRAKASRVRIASCSRMPPLRDADLLVLAIAPHRARQQRILVEGDAGIVEQQAEQRTQLLQHRREIVIARLRARGFERVAQPGQNGDLAG